MVNVLMYSTNNTACRSASLCPAPQFLAVPERQPSHYHLQALAKVLVTSDSRRRLGIEAFFVEVTGDIAQWFEDASDSVVGWFDDLAQNIQCARPPLCRSGILACATC